MIWEEIRKEYETSDITMKDLAEKHNAKLGTLKSRASREKWLNNPKKKVATKKATERKKVATKKVAEELNDSDLTERQKLFCLYYLQSFNATQSYIKAYECNYNTAMVNGSKLLRNPKIKTELDKIKNDVKEDLSVTITDIAKEHAKMAFSNLGDYLDFETKIVPRVNGMGLPIRDKEGNQVLDRYSNLYLKDSKEVDTSLIKEVKEGKDGITFKLYDRQKSMQELLKLISGGDDENTGVVFVDNEEAMNQYMAEHGEAYAD